MMSNPWAAKWNERYREQEFVYGESPNLFFKEQIEKLPIGTLLLPAEGEGRNAVFAASLGWNVSAFDISIEGKKKAEILAKKHQVSIQYEVGNLRELPFQKHQFDAIALIYAHFPAEVKSDFHRYLTTLVKPGGIFFFEAFSKNHLTYLERNEKAGGPKDLDMLFSVEEIESDFSNFEIYRLAEQEIELQEGLYHNGLSSVIRMVARKPS